MCGMELMFSSEHFWQPETLGSGQCKENTRFSQIDQTNTSHLAPFKIGILCQFSLGKQNYKKQVIKMTGNE